MKDAHLTLRLPADLDSALEAKAAAERTPKSQVVREAVVRYLSGDVRDHPAPRRVTAKELAKRWDELPRLSPEAAGSFADDISQARAAQALPQAPWE